MLEVRTIGYEQATQAGLIETLAEAGVTLLVDVRAIAASRRPGFAKRQLAAGLAEAGIDYLHLRALGTPKEGREMVRSGRPLAMRPIFEAHLATPEAQHEFAALAALLGGGRPLCLFCLERDPAHCHRSIIAEHLAADPRVTVTHLVADPLRALERDRALPPRT